MTSPLGAPVPNWKPAMLPPHITMRGRYCQLQPLQARHAPQLWREIADFPDLWFYMNDGPFKNQADFARWVEFNAKREGFQSWAICDLDGAPLGVSSYLRIDENNGSVEIGNVLFSPRLQRTRAATEAMFTLMRAAFEGGFRRYEWKCNALNAPSKRAALRLGFTYEGTFRNALVVKGRNRDTSWFSVIDSEWPRLQSAFEQWLSPQNFDASGAQIARLEALRAVPPIFGG